MICCRFGEGFHFDESHVQVAQALLLVEERTGQKFGDVTNPLLVSVRSGARASMPGMMDRPSLWPSFVVLCMSLRNEAPSKQAVAELEPSKEGDPLLRSCSGFAFCPLNGFARGMAKEENWER